MRYTLAVFMLCLTSLPGLAADVSPAKAYLVPYVGLFDFQDDNDYAQFGLEFRGDDLFYGLRPTIGANVTDEGDLYGYGGINWDIPLWENRVFLTPNVMVGAYDDHGGKDLGGTVLFRSGLEVSYAFEDRSRVGVAVNHVSNASIYDRNPGAETVLVNYQIPFN